MTSDLIAFLTARLDEDERTARDNDGDTWTAGDETVHANDGGGPVVTGLYGYLGVAGEHIARHDPARVLREVEAKRAIIAAHHPVDPCDAHDASLHSTTCDTLRLLALPCADHPDYRAEWAP